jgi:hypothetical protein
MEQLQFISTKERSKYIAQELGDRVTIEEYDEECNRVTFNENISGFELLVLFHAGVKWGHDSLAKALGY